MIKNFKDIVVLLITTGVLILLATIIYAKYLDVPGNKGLTVAAIIETSHIVMHTWDEPVPALIQFDVYSCGEFDENDICKKISKDFELTKIEYKYLNRETGLMDISGGILNYRK
jgi:S-adenosylmethionine/arginine decarboxylase-like enzyme